MKASQNGSQQARPRRLPSLLLFWPPLEDARKTGRSRSTYPSLPSGSCLMVTKIMFSLTGRPSWRMKTLRQKGTRYGRKKNSVGRLQMFKTWERSRCHSKEEVAEGRNLDHRTSGRNEQADGLVAKITAAQGGSPPR